MSAASEDASAPVVFDDAQVFAAEHEHPYAEAVAIRGDRIIAEGTLGSVERIAGPAARKVDLHGKFLMPGMIDAHVHPIYGGIFLIQASFSDAASVTALVRLVAEQLKKRASMRGDVLIIDNIATRGTLVVLPDPRPPRHATRPTCISRSARAAMSPCSRHRCCTLSTAAPATAIGSGRIPLALPLPSRRRAARCRRSPRRPELLAPLLGGLVDAEMRTSLLARPLRDMAKPIAGRIICACFGVGLRALTEAIADRHLTSVAEMGAALRAGTNCGSCLPELTAILQRAASAVTVPARASGLRGHADDRS